MFECRDKRTGRAKYGFVSLMDPQEFVRALKEMNGLFSLRNSFLFFLFFLDFDVLIDVSDRKVYWITSCSTEEEYLERAKFGKTT